MFEQLLQAVRSEVSGERALESVQALARFHRVQASPGYDEAAQWIASRLAAEGLEPTIETVPGDGRTRLLGGVLPEGWACEHATADLIAGAHRERLCDYATDKLSLVLRSAAARGRQALIDVGPGTEERDYDGRDVAGAVVLASGPVRRVFERAVLARGAAGILTDTRRLLPPVRGPEDELDALAYTSFWWAGDEPRGWGFVVTPRVGDRLRARLAAGERLELDVVIDSRRFATPIPLVTARIPGAGSSDVLVLAHLCHPQPSANDNASGAATNLETARVLQRLRERGAFPPGEHGVRFLWMPELSGTTAWLGRDSGRRDRLVAALNLDMVGEDQAACGSTLLLEEPPCFAASFAEELLGRIRERAQDWVTSFSGEGHYGSARLATIPYSGGSDHAILVDPAVGVPCPMLIQWPDRFYHSSHDTPDRCDPASLALAARCAATYAGFLAGLDDGRRAWLAAAVARAARVRLLRALGHVDAGRAMARERVRARAACSSLARVGLGPEAIAHVAGELDSFAMREGAGVTREPERSVADGDRFAARPRRGVGAPLDAQAHLLAGWDALSAAERARYHGLAARTASTSPLFELAWFACDGERTIADIARLVWLESGCWEPAAIAEFFHWTARLGLSEPAIQADPAWEAGVDRGDATEAYTA